MNLLSLRRRNPLHRYVPEFSFRTIGSPAKAIYREKGSKFLAFAYPVKDETLIKEKLEGLKKEYFDARHICYAWVLGAEKNRFRTFDDGEPNHSAGDPILGQIGSRNLTNILIVVVRYFGGVKLGVGGLIAAYRTAASQALENAGIVEEEVMQLFRLQYAYQQTAEIMKLVRQVQARVIAQQHDSRCRLDIEVMLRYSSRFKQLTDQLIHKGVTVEEIPLT